MNGVGKSGSVSPEAKYPAKGDGVSSKGTDSPLFTKTTRAIVWGMQTRAVQVCLYSKMSLGFYYLWVRC